MIDYSATKAAVWNLSKSLSKEFGARGTPLQHDQPRPGLDPALARRERRRRHGREEHGRLVRRGAPPHHRGRRRVLHRAASPNPRRSPTSSCCWRAIAPATSPAPTSSSTADSRKISDHNAPTNRKQTRHAWNTRRLHPRSLDPLRPPGRPGSNCSPSAATPPAHPAGPVTPTPSPRRAPPQPALDDVGIEQICHHYADHIDTLETQADRHRPLLRRSHRPGAARERPGDRRRRDRSRRRSRASRRCRSRSCAPASRCSATPRTRSGRSRSPPSSSATASATPSPKRNRMRCSRPGRFPGPAGRCSRTPPPTSRATRPPRSTPITRRADRCCSPRAATTTRFRRRSRSKC